ncbi:MAG: phytoene/squalene synthase family protein [Pseudomonadota bacterium]|nr:phytoene/squalene synthase family protein [Pseudomonadota bacterium]
MAPPAAAVAYCRQLLRRHDRDRYLASLFAPDEARPQLWGLYAFSCEIGRIPDAVTDPAPGEIRLTWWTQAIEALFAGDPIDHPVAQTLTSACRAGNLPQQAFIDLIEARRFDLYRDPMPSLGDLEGYLGETASAVVQLAALVLDRENAGAAASAAGFAGVAHGLVGLLRSLPLHRARGQCYVPRDVLARHGIEPEDVLSGRQDARMSETLSELRMLAIRRLGEARSLLHQIPPAALPAFLPTALVEPYAARLARAGTSALRANTDMPQIARLLHLWRAARGACF